MGHIKEQLHKEADADAAALVAETGKPVPDEDSLNQKLDAIQAQLTEIATQISSTTQTAATIQTVTSSETSTQTDNLPKPVDLWLDELEYTLSPGEGVEVKLVMDEGAVADYEWNANGAVLNYDTHGDGNGEKISYERGRSVPGQTGQLTAAFTGNHGWFWRNRTTEDVVVSLRTRGDYKDIVAP